MIEFDRAQQEAITVDRNAVVMAGAGSGKTTVLAERFFWLLENKQVRIDQILTLTFTQKAAAEMYEKIYNRLKETENKKVLEQLKDFDKAQISTLDSFCSQIARNSSEMFGIAPDYNCDEERLYRLAAAESLEFILARIDSEALKELIERHGFERILNDFFTDIAFHRFHPAVRLDFERMYDLQIRELKNELSRQGETWADGAKELSALEPRVNSIRQNQERLEAFGGPGALIEEERYRDLVDRLAEFRLTKPGGRPAPDIQLMKEAVDKLRSAVHDLSIIAQTLARADSLREIFNLLDQFQDLFNARKRNLGLFSFQDIAEMSIQALIRNKPLRQFYKNKFRYIMIDEFQDNNRLQKDLLYLLAEKKELCGLGIPEAGELEGDKLFFVGDEKQSIYRFRGADVSVFKSLNGELIREGGRAIELNVNYRSVPGLISFYNRLFHRVMSNAGRPYEARFQELKPAGLKNDSSRAPLKPEILIFYKPFNEGGENAFSNEESEAYTVAEYLSGTVKSERLTVIEEGNSRPAEFDDITVLMRSTSNQIHYERMFRLFGIPYSTQNVRSLFLEAPINDFYFLFQLAVYPEDRSAYAGLLRSPFVNVSDTALIRILLSQAHLANSAPFERIDRQDFSEEDRMKLEKGRELFQFVREKIDRVSISELIHHLWYKTGYRYFVLKDPRYHNYLEYYDYFIKLAEKADRNGESLAVFLDFLRENLGTYEKIEDLEILKPRVRGVQLMTIHKAKGLEFPIVVLADTGNRGRTGGSKPYYVSEEFGLTVNLGDDNYFDRLGKEEEESREIAESKRLLYVALTRAKSHLIISGAHNRQNQKTLKAHLNMILDGLELDSIKIIEDLTEEELAGHRSRYDESRTQEAFDLYRKAEVIRREYGKNDFSVTELSALLVKSREEGAGKAVTLPALPVDKTLKGKNLENNFGSLTHLVIARKLQDLTPPVQDSDWLKLDIPEAYREPLLESALKLAETFFSSPLGRLALGADRLETEYPFLYLRESKNGRRYISGRIDLTFENEDRLTLIDFKTDLVYRDDAYTIQLWLYRRALEELTNKEISCYLFLLRSGQAVPPVLTEQEGMDLESSLERILT